MTAKTESPKTKFNKVPAPPSYAGPAVWVNPAFFSFAKYEIVSRGIPNVGLLPASLRSLPPVSSENPGLVRLDIVIPKQESDETLPEKSDKGPTQTGVLYVNPVSIAAVIANLISPKATELKIMSSDADIWAKLPLHTVEGTPQEVAAKLGIELSKE
jgi:hypothetical protein